MKSLIFYLPLLGIALLPGCTARKDILESPGRVLYYDRNGDGKVDRETHHYPGAADADWELLDDNFDGRYDRKILYGIGIIESQVDIPVPTNVHISRKP